MVHRYILVIYIKPVFRFIVLQIHIKYMAAIESQICQPTIDINKELICQISMSTICLNTTDRNLYNIYTK